MVVIDSLKLIFLCDVFIGVSDRIQCHFFCRKDNNYSLAFTKPLAIASMIALQVVRTLFGFLLREYMGSCSPPPPGLKTRLWCLSNIPVHVGDTVLGSV